MVRARRVLVILEILGATAIIVATVLILLQLREKALESAGREMSNLSHLLEEQTTRAVQSVDLILRGTQERLREADQAGFLADGRAIHTLFRARIDGIPQVHALHLADAQGNVGHSSRSYPPPRVSVADQEFFRVHIDNPRRGLYIDAPIHSKIDGAWALQMSRRLDDAEGNLRGVVFAALDPGYFSGLYKAINLGEGSSIALYLRDGTRVTSWPLDEQKLGKSYAESPVFRALDKLTDQHAHEIIRVADGEPRYIAFRELADFPLVVTVRLTEDSILAGWRHEATLIVSGAVLVLFTLFLASSALRREMAREQELTAALHDSQARTRTIVESAMDAIISVDEDQRVVLFNPAAEKMFGWSAAEAMGASLDRFIPERYRQAHRGHVANFGATGISSRGMGDQLDIRALRADGQEFPIDASVSHGDVDGKKLFTVIVRDVTKRREAEEELRDYHARLRELSAALQSVREEERARIARELHDELGQQLTGFKMDLAWVGGRLSNEQPAVQDKIRDMKGLVDITVGSVRRIASELRPLMLDDLGLVPALEWLAEDFSKRTGIEVHLDLELGDLVLSEALATAMFRITQESLTNVARHAQARTVYIGTGQHDGRLLLTVRDDGMGMAPGAERKAKSFGLVGMQERARFLGGEAHIHSTPGQGTTIQVSLPVPQAAQEPMEERS